MTSTPSDELKACPFCGSDAHIDGGEDYGFYATCSSADCFCCVGEAYDRSAMPEHMFMDRDAAIAAWNRRPTTSRRSVLEEAARVAEELRGKLSSGEITRLGKGTPEIVACNRIASAIRALAEEE